MTRSAPLLFLVLSGLVTLSTIPETRIMPILGESSNAITNNTILDKIARNMGINPKAILQDPINPIKKNLTDDSLPPDIKIITPNNCSPPLLSGKLLVNGSARDNQSGLKIVQVQVDESGYSEANLRDNGNWSSWSKIINITDTLPHRIVSRASDQAGNTNWAEVTINSIPSNSTVDHRSLIGQSEKAAFAFVEPIFTTTAYGNHFYTFYAKYDKVPKGQKVTTDLNYLTAQVLGTAERDYFLNFTEKVREFAPASIIEFIDDIDVHNGNIFKPDGENLYDVLFLLHNEYVTQNEYDNFKRFVSNGGTIVFLDSNIFYGKVKFDADRCESTLVYGHDWKFDGSSALKSVHEGYYNETKEWVGSNFLYADLKDPIYFANNPFNYSHFEENYVNNPNVTIMLDYKAQIPTSVAQDNNVTVPLKIATYELKSGAGKVIMIGLYAQNLSNNTKFLEYFQDTILPRAVDQ